MRIFLKDNIENYYVDAELLEFNLSHLELWEEQWAPCINEMKRLYGDRYPEAEWEWSEILLTSYINPGSKSYCVIARGRLQGIMVLTIRNERNQEGEGDIFIDYIASAPWNRPGNPFTTEGKAHFSLVGIWLLTQAIRLSVSLGFRGRLALYSEHGAEEFYEEKVGLKRKGGNPEGEVYFELGEEDAAAFLAEMERLGKPDSGRNQREG